MTDGVTQVSDEDTVVGAYRILRKIGEGGMSAVYLGEHTLLSRNAAIKVLLPRFSADKEIMKRFFNEARIVSQLNDPGIVQIFDFGYHPDGNAFLVMELLDGESVTQRLRRAGRFELAECLRLVHQMCAALEVAHRQHIVHCDLKPGNLFLVGDRAVAGGQRVKILDFGIAKLLGDQPGAGNTGAGLLMGTPSYMSPEQCRGRSDIDARSDIYSLACVMFAMLTGRPPFRCKLPGDLISAHLNEPPPLASSLIADLPAAIDEILQRCLAKSPEDRFPSMDVLAEAIGAAQEALGEAQPMPAGPHTLARLGPRLLTAAAGAKPDPSTLHLASGQSLVPDISATSLPLGKRKRRPIIPLVIAAGLASGVLVGIGTAPLPAAPAGIAPTPDTPTGTRRELPNIQADTSAPAVPKAPILEFANDVGPTVPSPPIVKPRETTRQAIPIERAGPVRTAPNAPAPPHRLHQNPVRKGDSSASHPQSPPTEPTTPRFERAD